MPTFCTSPNRLGGIRPIKLETRLTLFVFYKCIHNTPLPKTFRAGRKHGSSVTAVAGAAAATGAAEIIWPIAAIAMA